MENQEKKINKKRVLIGTAIYAILFLLIVLVANLDSVNAWIGSVLLLLRPVLIGLVLAYLCNPFFRFFERKALFKLRPPSLRRTVSLLLTYLSVLLIVVLIFWLILPQLFKSIANFAGQYDTYMNSATVQLNKAIAWINALVSGITHRDILHPIADGALQKSIADFLGGQDLLAILQSSGTQNFTGMIGGAVSAVTDTVFGIFISLYLLSTKEKRYAQVMKVRRAMFSDYTNGRITRFCTIIDRSFGGFLEGKLIDSLIVGVLVYVLISIFRVPHAIMIASFIAITNLIPIVGILIGTVPATVIILLSDPAKLIPFLLIVVIVQLIDNNIISPKILGNNTGVSSLCVVIAISVMGALWGVTGMLLGVPLFAAVLEMSDEYIVARLQKKGRPAGLANYYATDILIDPEKNTVNTTDKIAQRFEKWALHTAKKQNEGVELTKKDRFVLRADRFLHRYHIIAEITDDGQARFFSNEAARAVEKEAAAQLEQLRAQKQAVTENTEAEAEVAPDTQEPLSKSAVGTESTAADNPTVTDEKEV